MSARHAMGALSSFSVKNIFYDKMEFRLFYFHVRIYRKQKLRSPSCDN